MVSTEFTVPGLIGLALDLSTGLLFIEALTKVFGSFTYNVFLDGLSFRLEAEAGLMLIH